MVPRLCLSPFPPGSQTLSPPGSSRSLLLLLALSLQSRDSSPPDKPVAPAGARERGRAWRRGGGRRRGSSRQQSSSHSCPAGQPQPPAPGASGRAGLGEGTQEKNWDTPAANTKLFLRSHPGYFPKPNTTSVLDRQKGTQGEFFSEFSIFQLGEKFSEFFT